MYSATAALGLEGAAALGCIGTVFRTGAAAGEMAVSIGLVPFQLDPARGSACDWLCGGLVENLVQIVGTALVAPEGVARGSRYCSGAASNFFAHPAQQKK
jgi:hypothetical protein